MIGVRALGEWKYCRRGWVTYVFDVADLFVENGDLLLRFYDLLRQFLDSLLSCLLLGWVLISTVGVLRVENSYLPDPPNLSIKIPKLLLKLLDPSLRLS